MSVVDQAVEDAVCSGGIADLLVPARDWQLRGQDCGTHLVAILADLPEVALLGLRESDHSRRAWWERGRCPAIVTLCPWLRARRCDANTDLTIELIF